MSIYKRGEVHWYKFMWLGKVLRESAKQGNDKVARQMEAAHRTSLAKGRSWNSRKKDSPTLKDSATSAWSPEQRPRSSKLA